MFEKHPAIGKDRAVYLTEEYLFFTQYKFHKQKLVLHRASMKFYQDYLERKNLKVSYIDSVNHLSDIRKLIPYLKERGINEIHFADLSDNWFEQRIKITAEKSGIKIYELPSPSFLNYKEELKKYFDRKKKYSQTDFYMKQRKKLGILIDDNGLPTGGKWTYDTENRLKYPASK